MTLEEYFTTPRNRFPVSHPLVIAEAGVNHEGSLEIAKRLIEEAKLGGADAIKFQSYKASTLASKDSPAYWDLSKEPTTSQFELFKKHDSFWKSEFETLARHCKEVGIEFLSTPFDLESAEFLDPLMSIFKISSSDITNRPMIEKIAEYGKPILLSTGASDLHEIQEAVSWVHPFNVPLCLLHCVLNYPTDDSNANLGMISGLREQFPELRIGYSDHTLPKEMDTCHHACLLGASLIEKHFTHDKSLPGNDHYHAMDYRDLQKFSENWKQTYSLLGSFEVNALEEEAPARRNARRSLVLKSDLPAGHTLTSDDLTWKRPAHGISPKHYPEVLGMQLANSLIEDTVLKWSHLK
jgi:sialic acid synthase SpsE